MLLRSALKGVDGFLLVLAVGLALVCPVWMVTVFPAVVGAVVLGGLVVERLHSRATVEAPPTESGWGITSDRLVDPASEELMIVWFNRRRGRLLSGRTGPV